MNPLIIALLLIGSTAFTESCPGCREVSPDNPIIHDYLASTLQGLVTTPKGLKNAERIQVTRILKAAFQVVSGIKFYYEFEGTGTESGNFYACKLVLIRRAWLNVRNIETYVCQQKFI